VSKQPMWRYLWFGLCAQALACARPAPQTAEYQGQSYREALQKICKVDELAGLGAEADPLEKSQKREDWLTEQVENPDAIYFRTLLKVQSAAEKSAALRAEAKKSGLDGCPLADTIAEDTF
jgi:hypothetical protein